jgi:CcmD family protein
MPQENLVYLFSAVAVVWIVISMLHLYLYREIKRLDREVKTLEER